MLVSQPCYRLYRRFIKSWPWHITWYRTGTS
jgi:hypothetical protein